MDFSNLPDDPKARIAEWNRRQRANEKLQCRHKDCEYKRYGCSDLCKQHAHERQERRSRSAQKAMATRRANYPEWGKPAHAQELWASRAHAFVATAIRRGVLPKLDGTIACTDCGNPAMEYDHRDYGRPLDVQ